jgi:hypothetical protein
LPSVHSPPPPPAPKQYTPASLGNMNDPPQPTFGSTMVTYFVLGVGLTLGITFVRVMVGLEGEEEQQMHNQERPAWMKQLKVKPISE